jgi:hypothetical protein
LLYLRDQRWGTPWRLLGAFRQEEWRDRAHGRLRIVLGEPEEERGVALSPEERELVGWFRDQRRRGRLPAGPFWLRPGTKVYAPELLYDELERRCAEPPYNPHARRPWLEELAALRRAVERPLPPPPADGIDADNR